MSDKQFTATDAILAMGKLCDYAFALQDGAKLAQAGFADKAKNAIKQADSDFPGAAYELFYLRAAVEAEIFLARECKRKREFDLHDKFRRKISSLIPGAKILKLKFEVENGFPDFMIQLNGEAIPVEIKRDKFIGSSLRQLQGYIKAYGCTKGIAVAPILDCELPSNVTFIALDYDEPEAEADDGSYVKSYAATVGRTPLLTH